MTNCSDSELACRASVDAAAENDARGLARAVRKIFARPFLLALALCVVAQGCVVIPGVEPTDLSVVEGHPSVGEIEKVLGEPLEIRTAETGEERIYAFDVGAEGVAEFAPGLVFTPGELDFLWITTPLG